MRTILAKSHFHMRRMLYYLVPPYIDRAAFPRDVLLVAGSGRSGTTWVSDVLAHTMHARIIFEPFLVDEYGGFVLPRARLSRPRSARNYPLYLPQSSDVYLARRYQIEEILSGRVRTFWSEMQSRPGVFRSRVVKEIRLNLSLGFLTRYWPDLKIILLLRDPCHVIESQLAKIAEGWDFNWAPHDVLSQERLMKDWLDPFRDTIEQAQTLVERLANRWCIETHIALRQLQHQPSAFVASYRWLCTCEAAWDTLRQFAAPSVWDTQALRRTLSSPSFTSRRIATAIGTGRVDRPTVEDQISHTVCRIVAAYGLVDISELLSSTEPFVAVGTSCSAQPLMGGP